MRKWTGTRKRARKVICGLGEEWLVAALTLWKSHQRVCVWLCARPWRPDFLSGGEEEKKEEESV